MRLHQVLTGAANVFDNSVAVAIGTIDGRPFTAYGSGYDVAVLDGDFRRVQILSDYTSNSDYIVKCITCSDGNGKIAASFGDRVFIFEPQPLNRKGDDQSKKLPYHWKHTFTVSVDSEIYTLCFDKDGKRLLVGSQSLNMWKYMQTNGAAGDVIHTWYNVWSRRMATPVRYLEFSPDCHYFASAGMGDRMIKIWFQQSKANNNHSKNHQDDEVYNFIYILHPKSITGLSWRQKSKKMPQTCVLNVLLTSCTDNICRVWAETVKHRPAHLHNTTKHATNGQKSPQSLTPMESVKDLLPGASTASLDAVDGYQDNRMVGSFNRYHLISMYHFHLAAVINPTTDIALLSTIPTGSVFGRSFQLQWLNNKEVQFTTSYELLTSGLLSSQDKQDDKSNSLLNQSDEYAVLDNMELDGDMEVNEDTMIEEKYDSSTFEDEERDSGIETPAKNSDPRLSASTPSLSSSSSMTSTPSSLTEKSPGIEDQTKKKGIPLTLNSQINELLHEWCSSGDTLFCIHPADGSLLIWLIDYLDDFSNAFYRQPQVSFASRIPAAFSKADANSLNWTGAFYYKNPSRLLNSEQPHRFHKGLNLSRTPRMSSIAGRPKSSQQKNISTELALTNLLSFMVSAHADGTLNLWQLTFSDVSNFTGVASVTHFRRNCGPRFDTSLLVTHPILPLVISTSRHRHFGAKNHSLKAGTGDAQAKDEHRLCVDECKSELMLWRSDLVGPLSHQGGVTETARISSSNVTNFKNVAWFPYLFEHSLVSVQRPDGTEVLPCTPCACFVTSSDKGLNLHQVILDSKTLLSALTPKKKSSTHLSAEDISELIESEQSGSESACIMPVCTITDSENIAKVRFLHVFVERDPKKQEAVLGKRSEESNSTPSESSHQSKWGPFYIVAVVINTEGKHEIQAWVATPLSSEAGTEFSPLTPLSTDSSSSQFVLSPHGVSSRKFHDLVTTCGVKTRRICTQELPLPAGVTALKFTAAVDIPSSSCQNNTCPAPFLLSVACSDSCLRFFGMHSGTLDSALRATQFEEVTDQLNMNIATCSQHKVLAVAHANPLRLAWICLGRTSVASHDNTAKIAVTVAEAESSGGKTWKVEDEVCIPYQLPVSSDDSVYLDKLQIGLNWMSLENGSFLLSAAIGSSIYIFCQVRTAKQPEIVSSSSSVVSVVKWSLLNVIELDGKSTNSLAWARDGVLLVGVKNELRVYSQWEMVKMRSVDIAGDVLETKEADKNILFSDNILYRAARSTAALPQYHPKHLIELMNMGKMRRVRAILCHLVRCVAGRQAADEAAEAGDVIRTRSRSMSRSMSSSLSASQMDANVIMADPAEESEPEIDTIPPLPLHTLFAADTDESGALQTEEALDSTNEDINLEPASVDYSVLFDSKPTMFGSIPNDGSAMTAKGTGMSKSAVYYGLAQAKLLAQVLTRRQLPGLSSMDQLYLLALSDTVASTNMDLESDDAQERGLRFAKRETRTDEKLSHWVGGGGYATTGAIGASAGSGGDVVDDCGLKFLLAMRHHTTLIRSLPLGQRASLHAKGLASANIAWAFHSDCQEELLAMVPGMLRGEPTWQELKAHGVGWWVKSSDTLKRLIEKLAKAHFQVNQDPLDCAIFYLASKKKTLLCALYRSLRDTKMSTFFSHDFTQERWRKAALKNAYSLLGKQRFEHAAAFFLLADALWDAIQICIGRLNDIQLALVISRLYEGEHGPFFHRILSEYILGEGSEQPHSDPFLRSMTHWLCRSYNRALETLLLDPTSTDMNGIKYNELALMGHPDIFNLYFYLRSHPYVRRCHLSQHSSSQLSKPTAGIATRNMDNYSITQPHKSNTVTATAEVSSHVTPLLRELIFRTANMHLNSGMPTLALEVLLLLPKDTDKAKSDEMKEISDAVTHEFNATDSSQNEDMIITGTFSGDTVFGEQSLNRSKPVSSKAENVDWSKPVSSKAEDIDWSKPVSSKAEDFDWSKPVSSKAEDFDWSKPVSLKAEDFDWSKPVSSKAEDFDWSKPVSSKAENFDWSKPVSSKAEDFDWSKPVSSKAEDFDWSKPISDGISNESNIDEDMNEVPRDNTSIRNLSLEKEQVDAKSIDQRDISALQLKYVTIFKCLIEELRSLPSTCTIEGVKLRPTVAHLLERELEVLHSLTDFEKDEQMTKERFFENEALYDVVPRKDSDLSQFSDDLVVEGGSEKRNLSKKAELLTMKINWLRENENVLTALYNCCALQGVGGENLPAICLELLFLLHELEHYHSLAVPLRAFSSGQTAPPLLLASMATFSLFANPVSYLRNMTHDILRMLLKLPDLPNVQSPVDACSALESMSLSLSSCIFHSLSGGHEDQLLEAIRKGEVKIIRKENKEGKLVPQMSRSMLDVPGTVRREHVMPTSMPSNWPGVQLLSSILAATNKEGMKNLKILLCESAIAVYLALLVSATSQFLPNQLYRIVLNHLDGDTWGLVFGGGTKLVLFDDDATSDAARSVPSSSSEATTSTASATSVHGKAEEKKKFDTARMKWNFRLLGKKATVPAQTTTAGKCSQQELFIPPQMTLYDCFLKKPNVSYDSFEYNSQDSFDSTSDYEPTDSEAEDSDSEDEGGLKMKTDQNHLNQFSYSWRLMTLCVVKIVLNSMTNFLNAAGLEMSDLPSLSPLLYSVMKLVLKWQLQLSNTFESHSPPENFLPVDMPADDSFTRGGPTLQKIKILLDANNTPFRSVKRDANPSKRLWHALVHQESLRDTFLELAFHKDHHPGAGDELESDVFSSKVVYKEQDPIMGYCFNRANRNMLAVAALHEVVELDVSEMLNPDTVNPVRQWSDRSKLLEEDEDIFQSKSSNKNNNSPTLRRNLAGTRRLNSHPSLPYYVTGGNDGSVRMFEFGHPDQIVMFRGPGTNDRVNRVRFNSLGNKFGAADDSGFLSLWTLTSSMNPKPFVTIKAYSRQAYDFEFLGSSSFLATAGHSSESNFRSARSQLSISHRKLLHKFQAHDSAIKCFALESNEEFFASGSADGDIKIWGLTVHELYDVLRKEHLRGTYLRHGSTGVQQLSILPSLHLMSCGSDGSLKLRQLNIVETFA
eukprot:gene10274-11329_t